MSFYKKLVGERLYLSPTGASEEEILKFMQWMNDFKITDYICRSAYLQTAESEKEWLIKNSNNPDKRVFNIIEMNTDTIIGNVAFNSIDFVNRSGVLGIFIGNQDFLSKGYGQEAINLMLEYGFRYLNLHSIRLDVLADNPRAYKCYLKCGFKETGKSRDARYLNGKYRDIVYMDILENEFQGDFIKNKNL